MPLPIPDSTAPACASFAAAESRRDAGDSRARLQPRSPRDLARPIRAFREVFMDVNWLARPRLAVVLLGFLGCGGPEPPPTAAPRAPASMEPSIEAPPPLPPTYVLVDP